MRYIQFAPGDDIIDIRRDNVFKAAFTRDTLLSQGALKRLVSAFVGRDLDIVTVTANEPPVTDTRDRQIRYDIRVRLDGGELADVEMTINPHSAERLRLEYYTARLFASQEIKGGGKDYGDLTHTWHISFIGSRRLFPDEAGIHRFEYYDREAGTSLDGRTHIIVVELEKAELMAEKPPAALSRGEKWALFFRYAGERGRRELVNGLLREEEGIAMAGEALLTVSRDEVERLRLDSEFKYELDHQSYIAEARKEGLAEGRAEGLAEAAQKAYREKIEAARKMKRDGLAAGQIAAYTGLSPEEIEQLWP
jgi:predicted transposase/invertase (TIGR01784 family)